ncbi:MAG TPA: hypothetical protein VGM97_10770 [Steroidobacteraceae bacterium]|jgi:hypothetical protein
MGTWINADRNELELMSPQSNPDPTPAAADSSQVDSPSQDDLLALIPDMELLETSAIDARTTQAAIAAAAGSGRKTVAAPKLSDQATATTVRMAAPKVNISDDPYADLMPELEAFDDPPPANRAIPTAQPAPPVGRVVPVVNPPPAPPRARPAAAPARPAPVAAPTATAAATKPQAAPAAARPAASPRKVPHPDAVSVPPVMDREFIARNHIVELYLSGRLPVRGATVFERFCRENPQILDEIGLPERVHTGLRLLESSGKPEPWQEKPKQFWERPYIPAGLSALVLILGISLLMLNRQLTDQTHKVTALRQLVTDQPVDAATATVSVDLQPTHVGPSAAIATIIGGSAAQLVNIKIDLTHSDFRAFRVTIDRVNQGRVAVLNNLIKDSNSELGFSLNTSAFGAGTYLLTIEGLDWRGDPQPDSWAGFTIRH